MCLIVCPKPECLWKGRHPVSSFLIIPHVLNSSMNSKWIGLAHPDRPPPVYLCISTRHSMKNDKRVGRRRTTIGNDNNGKKCYLAKARPGKHVFLCRHSLSGKYATITLRMDTYMVLSFLFDFTLDYFCMSNRNSIFFILFFVSVRQIAIYSHAHLSILQSYNLNFKFETKKRTAWLHNLFS